MVHVSVALDLSTRSKILGLSATDRLVAAREVTSRPLRAVDDLTTPEAEAVATELAKRIGERRMAKGAAA